MRIASTVNDSIVDGPGLRFTIFVQGCHHHCPGCHNPQTHSYDGGQEMSIDELFEMISANPLLDGVTFSGGEPFDQALELAELGRRIKAHMPHLNIITYTGYRFEYLAHPMAPSKYTHLLNVTDILIDGPFVKGERSLELRFRGSRNQRVLDCKTSYKLGKAVEIDI